LRKYAICLGTCPDEKYCNKYCNAHNTAILTTLADSNVELVTRGLVSSYPEDK